MIQHKELAAGRWYRFSLIEQMAHTASEVERCLNWRRKNNPGYSQKAAERAIELLDLTLSDPKHRGRLREIARVREALTDYLFGSNQYHSTDSAWQSYFGKFSYAACKHR